MKNLTYIAILILFCFGCKKDVFDPNNPNVALFVQQIKSGTYDCYQQDENGEKLWIVMPKFTKDHIQSLLDFSKDTSHIMIFPTNPISSGTPFPYDRQYIILGECLLWTVEGIRNSSGFGSLNPILIETTDDQFKSLNGIEILIVRDLYQDWWTNYKNQNWKEKNPLERKPYLWR